MLLLAQGAMARAAAQRPGLRAALLRALSSLPAGASVVTLPALSPTMATGSIAAWAVKEQQAFSVGQPLCEIETDKATVDFEAVDDGHMARILVPAGTKDLPVGTPIAVTAVDASVAKALVGMDLSFIGGKAKAAPAKAAPAQASGAQPLVSPAAAFLLNSYGVDARSVSGSQTLPSGNTVISKTDALAAVKGRSLAPPAPHVVAAPARAVAVAVAVAVAAPAASAAAASAAAAAPAAPAAPAAAAAAAAPAELLSHGVFTDVDLTTMRKVIATRLTEAKQSRPHFYCSVECEIDAVLEWRGRLKAQLGAAPSINDVIVKAAALALRDVPRLNCRLEADGRVSQNRTIDVAVAVATPTGLITPIVKQADAKGVLAISQDMKDLAARAKTNKLKLDEFQGGSLTISNLGMFGVSDFTAVISPPQGAILAVGGGRRELDLERGLDPDGQPTRATNLLTVQISADRRLVDDQTAAKFLAVLRMYLRDPLLMVL
jgi:pyruvate dehydrogenase E2 component (dihydrolipoamide acetyltransferase)